MSVDLVSASSQYLSISDNSIIQFGTGDFTVACWFQYDVNNGRVFSKHYNYFEALITTGNVLRCWVGSSSYDHSTSLSSGTWYHGALIRRSGQVIVSVDASETTPSSDSSDVSGSGTALLIGNRPGAAQYHDGKVAELAAWNVGLSATDIASLASGMSPNKIQPQNLATYLPLIRDFKDYVGGLTVTPSGGPSAAVHPRIYK